MSTPRSVPSWSLLRASLSFLLSTALLAIALAGCATAPPPRPSEYLDPVTGALVTTVTSPMIFARAHQDVSANSRQYVTVAAVTVNRSGHYDYVLLAYLWSTVDPRLGADLHPGQNVILLADDRAIRLVRDGQGMKDAGISTPLHAPKHTRGQPRVYRTDKETLEFLAHARRVRLLFEGDYDPRPFDVWKDGRRELGQLAAAGN
jgi:hypothetical protein